MEIMMDDSVIQDTRKSKEEPEEIEEEKVETPGRSQWLPEKFKTPEALAASYENLERELTKKSQELSERNRLIDEYLLSSLKPHEPKKKVDYSSLNEHGLPGEQLSGLVDQHVSSETASLREEIKELRKIVTNVLTQTETISLEPDFVKYSKDPEFINWAVKSFPQPILESAEKSPQSAAWLIKQYKGRFKSPDGSETETTDVSTDKDIPATVSGKKGKGSNKKVWSRTELTKLRAENPSEYQRLWPDIEAAYREGRVK